MANEFDFDSSIRATVDKLKSYPLTDTDMNQAIQEPTKIVTTNNLIGKLHHVDSILDHTGKSVLFIGANREANIGHWACAIRHGSNFILWEAYGVPLQKLEKKLNYIG